MRIVAARIEDWVRRLLAEPDRARRVYPVALLLLTLLVWFPTLFVGVEVANPDDFYHITQTALHHTPQDVAGWFTRGYWAYTHFEYRPLTRLSLLVNWWIAGPRPWAFHLGNVLLHFLCAWLVAGLAARTGAPVWGARLAGAVAAVFPPGQMAVDWINGRQDLLCGVLLLAGVNLYVGWMKGRSGWHLAGAAACVVGAVLAKEPGAAAPLFLAAAAAVVPGKRGVGQRALGILLIVIVLLPYVWVRMQAWPMEEYARQNAPQLRAMSVSVTWLFRDLLTPRVVELWSRWLPQGLTLPFDASFPQLLVEQVAFWAGLIVLLRRQRRQLALGVAWQVALYLPVHNLYWNPAFKHYRYLPHLGTAWLVGVAAWELAGWAAGRMHAWGRPLVRWSVVAVALALMFCYYIGQLDYRWPSWQMIRQGGPKPPATFGRSLTGPGKPQFDERSIYPPGEGR
ncbi:MAG TPA: hypothetical protein VMY87_02430 [Armatimonadota bacterium]|nr:hypothetical protein [Armatimonadota bacterium]